MKVFISHSSSDKKFVRTLKDDLTENNIDTWIDEDQIELGDTLSEKLEVALEQSSHFLIILSPASVNSEWVNFELEKAIKHKDTQLIQKIIPVKYQECEIPAVLAHMLYVDLSKEVRRVHGNKVLFIEDGYQNFLNKLCKAIRNSEKKLTETDKTAIKKEISKEVNQETSSIKHHIIKASYKLFGYKDSSRREHYSSIVLRKSKLKSITKIKQIKPVLLPPLLKNVFKNIEYGDKIYFSHNYFFFSVYGHFAGFRNDDLGITLEFSIRKAIGVTKGETYNVEINTENNRITFL